MLKLIILNGFPGSGKDTFVQFCAQFPLPSWSVYHLSTVTIVKKALHCLGWDGESKTSEIRDLLSKLKAESTRLFDGPFKYIKAEIERIKTTGNRIIFVDCREPDQIDRFKKEFGDRYEVFTMLIDRGVPENLPQNNSDLQVLEYQYDIIIHNTGTLDDLKRKAEVFMYNII